ncbi:hypothetical protein B0H13DRAFT_1899961 [Mycena leptocephala]|nr:hypothetical protein B0H13DRAFT_1899961 [Mycena leptocephala]
MLELLPKQLLLKVRPLIGKQLVVQGALGLDTPYKKAEEFFGVASPQRTLFATAVPGMDLPDPIQGMVLSGPFTPAMNSISQALRLQEPARIHRIFLDQVPEVDERVFHSEEFKWDLPPHMSLKSGRESGNPPADDHRHEGECSSSQREGFRWAVLGHSLKVMATNSCGKSWGPPNGDDDSDGEGNQGPQNLRDLPPPRGKGDPPSQPLNRCPSSNLPGPYGSGGGGSGGGGGGGGAHGAPYGTMVPVIEPKLKLDSLLEWDSEPNTAINYFWDVRQVAILQGWLPQVLSFWLLSRLKKGSAIRLWFVTLPT